ncbi:response regulator receiver domain-containing protein [Pseudomonas duriflava]|uniref:Response regulator receiver domain-containing protein n=1 Tax=Pseudomonas duriflava TaxID=459528 RepID=A0A562QPI6_9PSED|nr:response regulator [Pseudomonas duriflava]TWI58671.1 response regulator receiver domain-containing protein [Pseudomonas duriflava]
MIKIQLVDDEPYILNALQRALHRYAWEVHAFKNINAAINALSEHEYAVILSDYQMPDLDGITYLQLAKQKQPQALRMVLSAYGDRHSMMQAINKAEVYRFLSKPWEDYEIEAALRSAVDLYELRMENQRLLAHIRTQQTALTRQQQELQRLEAAYPGITQVKRDAEGAVLIEVEEQTYHG